MTKTRTLAFLAASIALFFAYFAVAANQGTTIMRGNFLPKQEYYTQAALTYFVDPATGSDSNNCVDVSTPCATVQAALNRVPKLIRHPVTITLASGTYTAGAFIESFQFQSGFTAAGAFLNIEGTLINATPATGTATGTATGGTAGTFGSVTWGTLIDSAQTWTVNDLRGKLIEITGGTGSGQIRAIDSNTADTITIAGNWTAPVAASSTYAIRDWGSVFTGLVSAPANLRDTATANVASIVVGENIFGTSTPYAIGVQKVKFDAASATANAIQVRTAGGMLIRYNNFDIGGTNSINATDNAVFGLYYNTAALPANGVWLLHQGQLSTGGFGSGNVIVGGATGFRFNTIDNFTLTGTAVRSTSGTMIRWTSVINSAFSGLILDTSSGGFCIDSNNSTSATGMGVFRITGSTLNACNSGGLRTNGRSYSQLTNVTGTNTGPGVTALNGGIVEIATTTAVTGSSDTSLDGVAYTYAAIRALTPKSVTDLATLSRIWEP